MASPQNSTAAYEWEYYYDYLDPPLVDQSKMKYNKYSIVIIFWIVLGAFVGFLFFSLNLTSRSGNVTRRNRTKNDGRRRAALNRGDAETT